jgi:hypothetical protein
MNVTIILLKFYIDEHESISASFPNLIKDFPAKTSKIIIRLLNLDNEWMKFASEIWPLYSLYQIRGHFENKGKTEAILAKWGKEDATTSQLLQVLIQMERIDIIKDLKEKYPSIK